MKDITKQIREYEILVELAAVPLPQRHQAMMGAELFFNRGWPNNHFTVGMAARAGIGLVPPVYEGLGSEERYFQSSKPSSDIPESACQLTAPELIAPSYHGGALTRDSGEREECTGWHRIDGRIEESLVVT
jgi:hypothetical protein